MSFTQFNLVNLVPLIKKGRTNKQIARHYNVNIQTVNRWVHMLRKEGVEIPVRKVGRRKKIYIDPSAPIDESLDVKPNLR